MTTGIVCGHALGGDGGRGEVRHDHVDLGVRELGGSLLEPIESALRRADLALDVPTLDVPESPQALQEVAGVPVGSQYPDPTRPRLRVRRGLDRSDDDGATLIRSFAAR